MRTSVLPVLAALVLAGPAAARQVPDAAGRPTVALVLSGGGARGFAHLGVLKVLDELRVPVDFVVGTSMGAVVGGVYATGMPYRDLESRFRAQDWTAVFRDLPDRRSIRLRQKRDDRLLTLPLELGVDETGVRAPGGLVAGAYLTSLLDVHTWAALGTADFDSLPIPFRAVATDVDSGEPVVLSTGSLSTALRASMAVPAVFPPVAVDGRLLVDGGVVENLPLRVAHELGADVAIAVDLSTGLDDVSDGESILSISQRVLTIFMTRNTEAQLRDLRERDVLIRPDLEGFSTADFTRLEDAVRVGEQAARRHAPRLRELALPEPEYRALVRRRASAWSDATTFVPGFVRIDTTATLLAPAVVAGMTSIEAGTAIDVFALPDEARAILGYGGFDRVEIGVEEQDGRRGMGIRPRDKPWGPGILRAGLVLFDRQRGDAGWDLTLNYAHTRLSAAGAQVRASLQFGSVQGALIELYQPLDARGRFFAALDLRVVRRDALLPADTGASANVEFADLALTAFAGVRLGTSGELRAGLSRGILRVERPALPGGGTVERVDAAGFLAELEIDRLDRVAFPRTGELVFADARIARRLLGGEQAFDRLSFDAIAYRSWGRHTWALGAFAGSGLEGTLPTTQRFTLGGLFRLTGVQPSAVQGAHAVLGRVLYRQALGGPSGGLHLGGSLESGAAWETTRAIDVRDLRLSASAFVGLATPLGPLHLAYGFTRGVDPGWILRFGTVF